MKFRNLCDAPLFAQWGLSDVEAMILTFLILLLSVSSETTTVEWEVDGFASCMILPEILSSSSFCAESSVNVDDSEPKVGDEYCSISEYDGNFVIGS